MGSSARTARASPRWSRSSTAPTSPTRAPSRSTASPCEGRASRSRKRDIAMVFQEFSLIPQMSVGAQHPAHPRAAWSPRPHRRPRGRSPGRRRAVPAGRRHRHRPARGAAAGRLPAAGRDRQGHLPGREHPHPRRADRLAGRGRGATLMAAVRRLTAEGIAVIYISHHLSEMMGICDQVTVLRDGNVTLSVPTADTTLADHHREHDGALAGERPCVPGPRRRPVGRGPPAGHGPPPTHACATCPSTSTGARSSASPACLAAAAAS